MDIVAGRDPWLFFGIELQQAKPRFEFGGGALVSRRHGTARPAPRSPEIDENRNIVAADLALERRGIDRDRFPGE